MQFKIPLSNGPYNKLTNNINPMIMIIKITLIIFKAKVTLLKMNAIGIK